MIRNETYRGMVVWNRLKKIDRRGRTKVRERRPEHEWKRIEVPALRIVSDELWSAVQARLSQQRAAYLRNTEGHLHGRPVNGVGSAYMLTGLAVCAPCGSGLTIRSRTHGN
jgi:site-specific DNA recombinase